MNNNYNWQWRQWAIKIMNNEDDEHQTRNIDQQRTQWTMKTVSKKTMKSKNNEHWTINNEQWRQWTKRQWTMNNEQRRQGTMRTINNEDNEQLTWKRFSYNNCLPIGFNHHNVLMQAKWYTCTCKNESGRHKSSESQQKSHTISWITLNNCGWITPAS